MNQEFPPAPAPAPLPEEPKKSTNVWLIIGIVVVVLCCCCIIALVALYFGYDSLGDPLHIYGNGSLPSLAFALLG